MHASNVLQRHYAACIPPSPNSLLNSSILRRVDTRDGSHTLTWILEASLRAAVRPRPESGFGEVPPHPPPPTIQVQNPAMDQTDHHTASAHSQPPDSQTSPWSEQALEMQRGNREAGEEEDSSGPGPLDCPHSPYIQQEMGPGLTDQLERHLLNQLALDVQDSKLSVSSWVEEKSPRGWSHFRVFSPLLIIGILSRQGKTSIKTETEKWNMTSTWE